MGEGYKFAPKARPKFAPQLSLPIWLRSSVVSVLFSLISEIGLRTFYFLIKSIFIVAGLPLSLLMLPGTVSPAFTLPLVDANLLFINLLSLSDTLEKRPSLESVALLMLGIRVKVVRLI